MNGWIISVIGVSLLSVISDVLLTEGQSKKYVKTVIAVVVTFVIIEPIVNFFNSGSISNAVTNVDFDAGVNGLQSNFLEYTLSKHLENTCNVSAVVNYSSETNVVYLTVTKTVDDSALLVVEQLVHSYYDDCSIVILLEKDD